MTQTVPEISIHRYFDDDHERLDLLFQQYQRLKSSDFPRARECFFMYRFGLYRHLLWEEEIVFPLFEKKTGLISRGPTFFMRQEHQLIKQHLDAIHDKLIRRTNDTQDEEKTLISILSIHHQKEQMVLDPAIDHAVSDEDTAAAFQAIQNIPDDRYTSCWKHA